tara:strand:- start:3752 stop:4363 length:612 start_codon:yes stop_codon:yes gene_type:complete
MILTIQKLESVVAEVLEEQLTARQAQKLMGLLNQTRDLMVRLQDIQGFYPLVVQNTLRNEEPDMRYLEKASELHPEAFKQNYAATVSIVETLYDINGYFTIVESLELEGSDALMVKNILYDKMTKDGPLLRQQQFAVPLEDLDSYVFGSITVMELIEELKPGFFGGSPNFDSMLRISDSFGKNYKDLKKYLDNVLGNDPGIAS